MSNQHPPARLLAGLLLVAGALIVPSTTASAATSPGTWASLPPPVTPPSGDHTATLMQDGRVLVVGGATCGAHCNFADGGSRSAALYDPAGRRWTQAADPAFPREYHTATLLHDGRVLVAGGVSATDSGGVSATAEVYSPRTGSWVTIAPMRRARLGHTATLLASGRVLVAGGISPGTTWETSTELFDPVTGQWTDGPPMGQRRADHTATLLNDGTVLVAGGRSGVGGSRAPATVALQTAEVYDPAANAWMNVPHLLMSPRVNHTATLLADSTVLLAGGAIRYFQGGTSDPTGSVEIYHPASRTFSTARHLPIARLNHSATLLADGRVLVVGGIVHGDNVRPGLVHHGQAPPEILDPSDGFWTPASPMIADPTTHAQRRDIEIRLAGDHTATLLRDGTVLVVGGDDGAHSAQLFDPASSVAPRKPIPTESSGSRAALAAGVAIIVIAAGVSVWVRRQRRRPTPQP